MIIRLQANGANNNRNQTNRCSNFFFYYKLKLALNTKKLKDINENKY